MEQYAYIRVSTKEQHIDRQIMALKPYSISPKNIYCDYTYPTSPGRWSPW